MKRKYQYIATLVAASKDAQTIAFLAMEGEKTNPLLTIEKIVGIASDRKPYDEADLAAAEAIPALLQAAQKADESRTDILDCLMDGVRELTVPCAAGEALCVGFQNGLSRLKEEGRDTTMCAYLREAQGSSNPLLAEAASGFKACLWLLNRSAGLVPRAPRCGS